MRCQRLWASRRRQKNADPATNTASTKICKVGRMAELRLPTRLTHAHRNARAVKPQVEEGVAGVSRKSASSRDRHASTRGAFNAGRNMPGEWRGGELLECFHCFFNCSHNSGRRRGVCADTATGTGTTTGPCVRATVLTVVIRRRRVGCLQANVAAHAALRFAQWRSNH